VGKGLFVKICDYVNNCSVITYCLIHAHTKYRSTGIAKDIMSNKKSTVTQCPTVPVEEEIEEDLKVIDETETPLLTGQYCTYICNE